MVVSPEMFDKFEKFSLLSFLRANPNTRWCPSPSCDGAFVGEDDTSGKVSCPTCGAYFCFECSALWHENMTCTEAKINNSDDDKK